MFDDLEGIVPRPKNHLELAKEIDEIFSNDKYKKLVLNRIDNYVNENTWSNVADKYINIYYQL
jgi:glycosyltransferase involved in cell wall biosynthesis